MSTPHEIDPQPPTPPPACEWIVTPVVRQPDWMWLQQLSRGTTLHAKWQVSAAQCSSAAQTRLASCTESIPFCRLFLLYMQGRDSMCFYSFQEINADQFQSRQKKTPEAVALSNLSHYFVLSPPPLPPRRPSAGSAPSSPGFPTTPRPPAPCPLIPLCTNSSGSGSSRAPCAALARARTTTAGYGRMRYSSSRRSVRPWPCVSRQGCMGLFLSLLFHVMCVSPSSLRSYIDIKMQA